MNYTEPSLAYDVTVHVSGIVLLSAGLRFTLPIILSEVDTEAMLPIVVSAVSGLSSVGMNIIRNRQISSMIEAVKIILNRLDPELRREVFEAIGKMDQEQNKEEISDAMSDDKVQSINTETVEKDVKSGWRGFFYGYL